MVRMKGSFFIGSDAALRGFLFRLFALLVCPFQFVMQDGGDWFVC